MSRGLGSSPYKTPGKTVTAYFTPVDSFLLDYYARNVCDTNMAVLITEAVRATYGKELRRLLDDPNVQKNLPDDVQKSTLTSKRSRERHF